MNKEKNDFSCILCTLHNIIKQIYTYTKTDVRISYFNIKKKE